MKHSEIVNRYNELAQTGTLGPDTWNVLGPGLVDRDLTFGGRPLCTVLRPLLHTRKGWTYLQRRTELVLSAFNKLTQAMLGRRSRARPGSRPRKRSIWSLCLRATTPTSPRPGWTASSPTSRTRPWGTPILSTISNSTVKARQGWPMKM